MRRPGSHRLNRRSVGGWGPWKPTRYSGCVLWLRGDLGVTTVDAAVVDGSDFSTANWTKTNCTATATTITDSNDGAGPAVEHYARQTVANVQANHAATVYAELKAGTKTWALLRGGGWSAYVNLSTGAAGTLVGCTASISDAGGGWWAVTLTVTATSSALFDVAPSSPGDGGVSYIGDGTGTVLARAASVTQRNVSAWADQSGNGRDATQATAAARPLLTTRGGTPAIYFANVGTADYLATGAFTLNQPATAFVVAQTDGVATHETFFDGQAVNTLRCYRSATPKATIYAGVNLEDGAWSAATPYVVHAVFDGASSEVGLNGVATTGNAGATGTANGLIIGAAGGPSSQMTGYLQEIVIYNRALTAAERQNVERYLGARYGIAVS